MKQKGVETDQRQNKKSLSAFLEKLKEKKQAESLRKQAHHAVSLFYEMGHPSDKKTRNGTSNGNSAAYGRTEPDISFYTKKVAFNQAVFSDRKTIPQTSKPGSDTNMAPGQSGADWRLTRMFLHPARIRLLTRCFFCSVMFLERKQMIPEYYSLCLGQNFRPL